MQSFIVLAHQSLEVKEPQREHPASNLKFGDVSAACDQLNGMEVLAVDDERDAQEVLRPPLEERGPVIRTAGSASQALSMRADRSPTVLISDIGMPKDNGYTFILRFRALPAEGGGDVPAVALAACACRRPNQNYGVGFSGAPVQTCPACRVYCECCRHGEACDSVKS